MLVILIMLVRMMLMLMFSMFAGCCSPWCIRVGWSPPKVLQRQYLR